MYVLEMNSGPREEKSVLLTTESLPESQVERISRTHLALWFLGCCQSSAVWLFQPGR